MNNCIQYALVAFWSRKGCKIIADYPENFDPVLRAIVLSIVDSTKVLENDKISIVHDNYTVHISIGELHYVCLTSIANSSLSATTMMTIAQNLLEKVRNVYRELPIFADFSVNLPCLAPIDLSKPLKIIVEEYNAQGGDLSEKIEHLEAELAEIRRSLMDGVQKLIDRGQRLDELVRKTQSLQITSRKDFHVLSRSMIQKKRNKFMLCSVTILMIVTTSAFIVFLYLDIL
ncbi:uncharacterized protein [Prorops nasuta]|uniref:uncharacterized protein n=1 Tax=Prorops nasuta TaxID=863751 RepID=UPI0034CE84AF